MKDLMSPQRLEGENAVHAASGGCSDGNHDLGFRAAFFDYASQRLYLSRFADGRLAPVHLLDGLPEEVVVDRALSGRVIAARASLVAGFERHGLFYTRKSAARAAAALRSRARQVKPLL